MSSSLAAVDGGIAVGKQVTMIGRSLPPWPKMIQFRERRLDMPQALLRRGPKVRAVPRQEKFTTPTSPTLVRNRMEPWSAQRNTMCSVWAMPKRDRTTALTILALEAADVREPDGHNHRTP